MFKFVCLGVYVIVGYFVIQPAMISAPVFKFVPVFYLLVSQLSRSVQSAYRSQNLLRLNNVMRHQCQRSNEKTKNQLPWFDSTKTQLFHVGALQRTEKRCSKIYKANTRPLVCSLNLSGSVLVQCRLFCRGRLRNVQIQ